MATDDIAKEQKPEVKFEVTLPPTLKSSFKGLIFNKFA